MVKAQKTRDLLPKEVRHEELQHYSHRHLPKSIVDRLRIVATMPPRRPLEVAFVEALLAGLPIIEREAQEAYKRVRDRIARGKAK